MRHLRATVLLALALAPARGWAAAGDEAAGLEQIIIAVTRSATLIADEPLRVAAVPAEEIEENLTVAPGNLSTLLTELPGIRLQAAAPSLGCAGLQLRGMRARDTLVLSDGLPLLDEGSGSCGILQTPPLDLQRVEVIQGTASALYGGSALGGVLNLVSQTAAAEPTFLANVSTRGGRDLLGYYTGTYAGGWSGSLTAGAHDQSREEISDAGWADLPGYRRYTLRPRLWWQAGQAQSLFLTAGLTDEYREGGTMPGSVLPDGTAFAAALHTQRVNGGLVSHWSLDNGAELNGRTSLTATQLDRTFGAQRVASTQTTAFAEGTLGGIARGHAWLVGIAFNLDELASPTVPGVSYHYTVPAVMVQDELAPTPWLKLAGSARLDVHSDYGTFFSPRLSALFRQPGTGWSLRASLGSGFSVPTPFVDEIEATSLAALLPMHGLHAERAVSESLDAKWSQAAWDVNVSLFNAEIRAPLQAISAGMQQFELHNAAGARRMPGAEILIRYVAGPLQLLGSWSAIDATEPAPSGARQSVPLVPRQAAEVGLILESPGRGRLGFEAGYTGSQALAENPYRSTGEAFVELNALGELRVGGAAIFLNAINLTDVRQTHYDPLLRPTRGPGDNPITDVWAPLDGRRFNLGIRAEF